MTKAAKTKFEAFIKEINQKLKITTTEPYIYMDDKPKEPFIGVQWSTGGISGGSCWDDGEKDNHYPTSGEIEPEFEELDKVLEHFYPGITHLQYKRLCRQVIETGDYRMNEYYGNSTNYAHKFVRLQKLYDTLKEEGWLPERFA